VAYGGSLKPRKRTVEHHIHPSSPLQTDLQTRNLRATKTGFTALRDTERIEGVYSLDELVGKKSEFGFDLKTWDGR
jgi:hypothetical protein